METVPAVFLVIGAAIAWLGITAFVIIRFRRRRSGSTLVGSAPPPTGQAGRRHGRVQRRVRVAADGKSGTSAGRRLSLKERKARR
jgi:hypothetical protein